MLVVYPLVYLYPVSARVRATEVEWDDLLVVYESPPQIRSTTHQPPQPALNHSDAILPAYTSSLISQPWSLQSESNVFAKCVQNA